MKRRALCFAFALFAWTGIARANEAPLRVSKPAVRDAVIAVVEAQLAAFREGDAGKAYRYASEAFRAQVSASAFAGMVKRNYPEIWRSTRAEIGIVRDDEARAAVLVHVFAKNSDAIYDYVFYHDKAGWRIGGVVRHDSRKDSGA